MSKTRRVGEPKDINDVFNESNSELIGNLMKGIHLDGGGKLTYYKDRAKVIINAIQLSALDSNNKVNIEEITNNVAKVLHCFDYERLTAVRSSMLKRSVLLKLRFNNNGKNVDLNYYELTLKEALNETKNHSKKLLNSIS